MIKRQSSRLSCLKQVTLANPYLRHGHVRWQDEEHLLREEHEVTGSEDQKGFFQRIEPVCEISTASQRRITPSSWSPGFQHPATCLPLSPYPFLLEWKYLMWISFPYSNIVHWGETYILSLWKRATCNDCGLIQGQSTDDIISIDSTMLQLALSV